MPGSALRSVHGAGFAILTVHAQPLVQAFPLFARRLLRRRARGENRGYGNEGLELFAEENIDPTEDHWDTVRYVRQEALDGNEPNERGIMKAMGKKWGRKVSSKEMYEMFPEMPSKQGLKIGGCPQSTRKGGY